ncbi:MAG: phosphoribosylglycinamide formyltransferase [Pseudomonadota bacterium]
MIASKKIALGILVSGSGTNLQAIIDAASREKINAEVKIVISDVLEAKALERARKHNTPAIVIERKSFESKKAFEQEIADTLKKHGVELVCLAGFMRIIGRTILDAFPNQIINIHPALLPSFPGLDAQKQAFDYGVKVSGATVHFVDEKTDHGPIICQVAVDVHEDDTVETLKARILKQEHRIYPEAIQLIAEGRVSINGRTVHISDQLPVISKSTTGY